ncbi:MAG: cupin domain-containing protein [Planococcus donghaensis]
MATQQTITNIRTGQRMIFRRTAQDTKGELLEIESFNPPSTEREPEHIHPKQESSAEVVSGVVHFSIDGRIYVVGPGEKVTIPPGVPHYFWNEGPIEAHTIQRFTPALTIEQFFKSYFALANAGKLNSSGMPPLLITSHLGLQHQNDIQVTKPPWILQKILYSILIPIRIILRKPK